MLHYKTSFAQTKILIISIIAISLAACGETDTTNTQTDSTNSSPTSLTTSASPQATDSSPDVTIPGVNNVGEIKFTPASPGSPGFFDTVNGSNAARVEVKKSTPVTVSGWAVLTKEGKIPDRVIITHGDNNSAIAVVPVSLDRPDVVKALKNPNYKNSGWSATFNSDILPTDTVVLKAWAYNAANKEATQLGNTHEVVLLN